jgi:hypothetical protein
MAAGKRYALPSGGWFELRDYRELRAKDRKVLLTQLTAGMQVNATSGEVRDMSGSVAALAALDATEGLAALLITAWEVPGLPAAVLPSQQIAMLGELTMPDYDTIAAAVEPAYGAIIGARTVDPSDAADPSSPSGPASG